MNSLNWNYWLEKKGTLWFLQGHLVNLHQRRSHKNCLIPLLLLLSLSLSLWIFSTNLTRFSPLKNTKFFFDWLQSRQSPLHSSIITQSLSFHSTTCSCLTAIYISLCYSIGGNNHYIFMNQLLNWEWISVYYELALHSQIVWEVTYRNSYREEKFN